VFLLWLLSIKICRMPTILTGSCWMTCVLAGPRWLALRHKYALFTYSLANSIFAAKQRAYAANSACHAAQRKVTSVLAQTMSSLAGLEAEDAQALAGHWQAATVACLVLVLVGRAVCLRWRRMPAAKPAA
jgi:hypothetical protein